MAVENNDAVVAVQDLPKFFHEALDAAMRNQQVRVAEATADYVANLLTHYARSESLYEHCGEGRRLNKPLAIMLADAVHAEDEEQRRSSLQRLGDVSLFIAGFFADSLANRPVDVDYYVRMGGNAYDSLSDGFRGARGRVYRPIFGELARKFQSLVDVLNEISDMARADSDRDLMRLYDLWRKTGSRRAERLLRKQGVLPLPLRPRAPRLAH